MPSLVSFRGLIQIFRRSPPTFSLGKPRLSGDLNTSFLPQSHCFIWYPCQENCQKQRKADHKEVSEILAPWPSVTVAFLGCSLSSIYCKTNAATVERLKRRQLSVGKAEAFGNSVVFFFRQSDIQNWKRDPD